MKLFTKLWFTLLCILMAGVTNVYADDEVALTSDMFYTWDGYGADASSIAAATVDFNIGTDAELGAGAMVCGTSTVDYLTYADLTGSTKLIIAGTAGMQLRVLMNRQESNSGPLTERNPTIGDNGTVELDLTDLQYVHLNAIKTGWNSPSGKITSIKMVKPSDPLAAQKENLSKALSKGKLISNLAYTEASFTVLTNAITAGEAVLVAEGVSAERLTTASTNINNAIDALALKENFTNLKDVDFGVFDGWGASAKLTQKLDPTWVLFAATGQSYGDPSVNNRADVSAYDKLYIVTASGTPRILLNRDADGGQWSENESDSHLIDNTQGGWSAKYFSTEGKVFIVDLKQLVADKGFAHLTAIKSKDNNVVTGMYLYKAPTFTATFTTNRGWEKVYAYAWTTANEQTTEFLGAWPGTELTATDGVYTVSIKADAAPANIIFNNGNNGGGADNQTSDLVFENGKAYEYNAAAQATEATFDFNASNHAVSASGDASGDITKDEVNTVNDVVMTISPASSGTPNRYWGTNNGPQLRMYGGTMTLEAPEGKAITKVIINNGKWNNGNTFNGVAAEKGEWEGNSTNIVLAIAGNTQMNSVVVTLADKTAETTTYGTEPTPEPVHIANTAETAYTVAKAIELIDAGEALSDSVYVKGIVSRVDDDAFNSKYNSVTYWISADGTTDGQQFECYSGKGLEGADFASKDDVAVGASVIVKGTLKKYGEIYEFTQNNYLVSYEAPVVLNTYTATFTTNQNWEKVYAYVWSGEGENKLLGDWPGTELTANEGVYTVTIQAAEAPAKIIFNSGAGVQTEDLAFENGKAYEYNKEDSELMAKAKALAADAEAVAVGKLNAAITAAQSSGNEDNLQTAIDQFTADNADMEKDETAKVKTDGWKKFDGSAAGVCATQYAPAITTYDGRNAQLAEVYEGNGNRTGIIIYQDITGLANGSYKVGFYGNAFSTSVRDGFECTMEDGANDVAYVFANDEKAYITARIATSTTENNFRQFDVVVTDGTIKLGMGKDTEKSTNWHTMQIHQLTWFTTAKAAYAAVKAEMETEIASAKALKTESRTAGVDEFNAAIEAAEAAFDSNMLNVPEFEAELANLKAAAAAFKKANYFIDLTAGEYYIIDAEGGKMMAAGHDYGTRGIVNEMGLDLTITPYTESRTVTIDSRVSNGGNSHFLSNNLYMDGAEWGWALEYQGFGFYILEPNSGKYINLDDKDNLVLSDTPREFIIVTKEGVMAQRMQELAEATAETPVDATFLIKANNFNRNDARNAEAWTVSEDCTNKNLCGGADANRCAESYHSTFTIMQTIENAPAGIYKMTAQGFYRQDTYEGDAPAAPQFFANGVNGDVPVKSGEEGGMADASASFTNGLYTIEPIEFEVKEDGMMYVGITASTNTQWVIFDNFQLTYYGPTAATKYTVAVAETQNGEVKTDKAEAAEGETVTVTVTPAEGFKVDEAYWTTEGSETKNEFTEPEEGNAATFTMPAANVTVTVTFKAISGPVEIEKFYIMGTGTTNEWNNTTEMTYNEETQAFEYTVEGESGVWIAFSDIDWTASDDGWADFNGNHRYAIGKGNQNATVGEAMQLQKTEGEGTIVLAAGKYNISVTKNLLCTITKVESELPVEGVIYSWESPEGTPVEYGGKIEHVYGKDNRLNYLNSGYYTICLNGKKANVNDTAVDESKDAASRMIITLDNAVAEGDTIAITGYITKNSSAKSSAWIVYENGATAESAVFGDESNIFVPEGGEATGVINTKYVIVSAEAAGSKTITLTRGQTGTNLFITKLQVIEKKAEPETIETMYIVGELTGGWPTDDDWSNAKAMTQDAENAAVWTLNVESFEAEAKTYKYKATANGKWGVYELPASGDYTFTFGTEEFPAGKYSLLFTVNTTDNTLTLVATKSDATGINTLKTAIENGAVYNLNGQKVMKAQKGLYIINGKKVVKK